jgi:hypothetical protein
MSNKKEKSLLRLGWGIGIRVAIVALLVFALSPMSGCTPDIPNDYQDLGNQEMIFDTTKGIIPTPNVLVMNQTTGTLDLSQAGIHLPGDMPWSAVKYITCTELTEEQQEVLPIAACEFYQYLTSLDGFPINSTITAPASADIDLSTVNPDPTPDAASRTLLVAAVDRDNPFDRIPYESKDLDITSELSIPATQSPTQKDIWNLTIKHKPLPLWDVNKDYIISVRGYENGIKSTDDKTFVSSATYLLLKKEDSLTCGKTTGSENQATCEANPIMIPESCPYYTLLEATEPAGTSPAVTSVTLCVLEYLRTQFLTMWLGIDFISGDAMPSVMHSDAAIAWAFPTHSGSVAPLQSSAVSATEIHIPVYGTVDETTLSVLNPVLNTGTIALIDLTALDTAQSDKDRFLAFMMFTPEYENGVIKLIDVKVNTNITTINLLSDHIYGIFMKDGITNATGKPLVPAPTAVLLKAQGEVHDGVPRTIRGLVGDDDASAAEQGRLGLKDLLDNMVQLLPREHLVYIYAFTYTSP